MGTDENKKYTQRFLELYFDVPLGSLSDIEILNSVKMIPKNINIKTLELDVLVKIPSLDTIVILEMQKELNHNTFTKNALYLFCELSKEFKRGEEKYTNTPKIILINLVKHICDYYDEDIYALTGRHLKRTILQELFEIINVEVEKQDEKCYNKNRKEISMWYELMNANTEEKLNEVKKKTSKYPLIKEAIKEMETFNNELYGTEYWLTDWLYRKELESKFDNGYSKGESAGYSKGETNKQYKIALKMLDANEPIEKINLFTEIPLEELKTMKKNGSTLQKVK